MPTNPDQSPWEGCHVYRVLKEKKNGRRYALISGWPTPVSEVVRTLFPPLPYRASYSLEARRWAKRKLRENANQKFRPKADRRWIGAYSLRWLRAVAAGKKPLNYWDYMSLKTFLEAPKPVKQVLVPVRLQLQGWGQTAPAYQPLTHKAGRNGYGKGGYVTVPDLDDDSDED